ncbi:MAG: RtcB family protein [Oscillospiraceae bacterium]|nr:RtcB family protein [Oscillospiraceae bacterium]
MFIIQGAHASAKIFSDRVDETAAAQITELCCQPFAAGAQIRIMPDVHAGKGCTIGTTMTVTDKLVPNLVGVDIGCGMETTCLRETHFEPQKLDKLIRASIPSGFAVRESPHRYAKDTALTSLYCYGHIHPERALHSIGTLGGGNHFIEVDRSSAGQLCLVIHSGSRHLGVEVADYYQREAYRRLNRSDEESLRQLIADMKAQGQERHIEEAIRRRKTTKQTAVPAHLAYCEGTLFEQYLHDMAIVQAFADCNRRAMTDVIVKGMHWHIEEQFTTMHNYIDTQSMILRKGAVSAKAGEVLLIPMNMRDGSLLCRGKGNPDWNCSAPHGAGRLMSRAAAKERCTMADYKQSMQGIYTTCIGRDTIDESPMVYKPVEEILGQIGETVTVLDTLRPVFNFKAGSEEGKKGGRH